VAWTLTGRPGSSRLPQGSCQFGMLPQQTESLSS
jgi:hypothetical protein